MPYGFHSRSYNDDGSLQVLLRPVSGVPSGLQTGFDEGWARDRTSGCSYVEFVGSSVPSSSQVSKWGRVTQDGALCVCAETSPASGDYVHQSIRYRKDGAMYVAVNGNANANTDQQTRLGRLTRTGAMYLDALSFLADFTDAGSGAVNTALLFGGVAATFTRATAATTILSNRTIGNVSTGVARSYYLPDGTYGGYLAEGARTNLVIAAENFSFGWAAVGTPTRSAAITACGSVSLDLIGDDTAAALEGYTQTVTFTGDAVKAVSLFVAQGSSISSAVRLRDTTANADRLLAIITWSAGAPIVSMTTGTFEGTDALAGGIYRIRLESSSVTAANTNSLQIYPATDAALSVANQGTIAVGGVQAEDGTFCSTYIPTVSSTVARNADVMTYPLTGWFNAATGTMFVQGTTRPSSTAVTNGDFFGVNDGTANEAMVLTHGSGGAFRALIADGGVEQGPLNMATPGASAAIKCAFAYAANDLAASLNAATPITDATATLPTVTTASIGNGVGGTLASFGQVRRVAYYATRLSNAQLQQITS